MLGYHEPLQHHGIAPFSLFKPFVDACDGARAQAGFFFDNSVGDSLREHAGDFPAFGEFTDLSFGEEVAEKLPAFVQALQPGDRYEQIVDIFLFEVSHTLPR